MYPAVFFMYLIVRSVLFWLLAIGRDLRYLARVVWATLVSHRTTMFDWAPKTTSHPSALTVILVHGSGGSHLEFLETRDHVQRAFPHAHILAPSLPGDRHSTVTHFTHQLHQFVDKHVPQSPVIIIGHSMGGLIALDYLRMYPNHKSVQGVACIASPLQGASRLQHPVFRTICCNQRHRDMHPHSKFIQQLNTFVRNHPHINLHTYSAEQDLHVPQTDARSCVLSHPHTHVSGYSHFSIVTSEQIWDDMGRQMNSK